MTGFVELADRVYALRYPVLDVTVALVVGDGGALVVDTLSTAVQAAELGDAIRAVTPKPLTIVNTHHHFDHCFGNATLAEAGTQVWAHEYAAAHLRDEGDKWQREWYEEYRDTEPELAQGLAQARILAPDRVVHQAASLDLGGRRVLLERLPFRIARRGRRGQVDVRDVALVQADEAWSKSSCPTGQLYQKASGERVQRARMSGPRAGAPA